MADNKKLGKLEAIAQGGTAGGNAYDTAISNTQAQKQQAVQSAAARANAIGAPEAFLQQQAALVAQPADTAIPVLNTAKAALGNYLGSLNAANSQYMAGVGQSRSLLESVAAKQATAAQSAAEQDATSAYEKILTKQRTQQSQSDAASAKAAKQNLDSLKEDALVSVNPDMTDTVTGIVNRHNSLGDANTAVDDADLPDTVKDELRDRLLKYYDPERWLQTSPTAAAIRNAPTVRLQ